MKILWDNLIDSATLSSINASLNYPVTELQNPFLEERYQSSIDTDTITILFEEDESISDFFWGYTNATKFILRLYNYENDLLFSITINNPDSYCGAIEFDMIDDVSYIELYIEGPLAVYLGGIGLGIGYIMPDPLSGWEEATIDNSAYDKSTSGQTLQNYTRPLRAYPWKFQDIPLVVKKEIMELYYATGQGKTLWFDFFELAHDFMKPMFGNIKNEVRPQKDGRRYNFEIYTEEAR